jgi:hypothetical protein
VAKLRGKLGQLEAALDEFHTNGNVTASKEDLRVSGRMGSAAPRRRSADETAPKVVHVERASRRRVSHA